MQVQFKFIADECGCSKHTWHYHYKLLCVHPCSPSSLRTRPRRIYVKDTEQYVTDSLDDDVDDDNNNILWYTSIDIIAWDDQFETFVAACGTHVDRDKLASMDLFDGVVVWQGILIEQTEEEREIRKRPCYSSSEYNDDLNSDGRSYEFDLI